MKLSELEIVLGIEIKIDYYQNRGDIPFNAKFPDVEIMEKGMLLGSWGGGKTVEEAVQNYCEEIQGKRIVIDARDINRREFQLPPKITSKEKIMKIVIQIANREPEEKPKTFKDFPFEHLLDFKDGDYGVVIRDLKTNEKRILIFDRIGCVYLGENFETCSVEADLGPVTFEIEK